MPYVVRTTVDGVIVDTVEQTAALALEIVEGVHAAGHTIDSITDDDGCLVTTEGLQVLAKSHLR